MKAVFLCAGSELRALMIFILFILAVLNKLSIGVYVLLIFVAFINLYFIIHFLQLGRKHPQKCGCIKAIICFF